MIDKLKIPEEMLRMGLDSEDRPEDTLYPEDRPDGINMLESDDYDESEEDSEEENS